MLKNGSAGVAAGLALREREAVLSFRDDPMSESSSSAGPRIAREKRTVRAMVTIYCRGHGHGGRPLCPECADLLSYALCRLDRCPFGEEKTTCAKCPIHCYKPAMRDRVKEVMRYAGPRMLLRHPILALRHQLDSLGSRRKAKQVRKPQSKESAP